MDPDTMNELFKGAVSGASEGAANLAILGAWEGGKFLWRKIRDHPEKAQEIALKRVIDLSERTSLRINALEQEIGSLEEQIGAKLSNPDFIFLFHNACIAAARTEGQNYHELLARLISDRLISEPDSLRNLASNIACNAIPQLSNTHLRFLGVMAVLYILNPPEKPLGVSSERLPAWAADIVSNEISPMMPIGKMTEYDYTHLAATSCITFIPTEYYTLDSLISPNYSNLLSLISHRFHLPLFTKNHLEETSKGKELFEYWKTSDMRKASLTSAGALIGTYVKDLSTPDRLRWDI